MTTIHLEGIIRATSTAQTWEIGGNAMPVPLEESPVHAPDFPSDLTWFNVERPLRLADLRGRLVLLDFWTYC